LLFSVYSFCKATFFHSGYVIKPPQPNPAIYGAPPFTGNPSLSTWICSWCGKIRLFQWPTVYIKDVVCCVPGL